VTVTLWAVIDRTSVVKELIPTPEQLLSVFLYQPQYTVHLAASEATTHLQPDRVEPKLGCEMLPLNMNVRRLITVTRIKEESIRALSQYGWHRSGFFLRRNLQLC
jgi:hypothetical protein